MKVLKSITDVGSRCCKATGWRTEPPYSRANFTDGTTRYIGNLPGVLPQLERLKSEGVDVTEFEKNLKKQWEVHSVPEHLLKATHYQNNRHGYDQPEVLGEWQWSTTFGRWGRFVKFTAQQEWILTYPELPDRTKRRLEQDDPTLFKTYAVFNWKVSYETPVEHVDAFTQKQAEEMAKVKYGEDSIGVSIEVWYSHPFTRK